MQAKFLDGTSNQIVLPFTFFQSSASETTPTTESRQKRVFEMRSYDLKVRNIIFYPNIFTHAHSLEV